MQHLTTVQPSSFSECFHHKCFWTQEDTEMDDRSKVVLMCVFWKTKAFRGKRVTK